MTDPPVPASPLYGVAPSPGGGVDLDVTDAALTRLVDLLDTHPHVFARLAVATDPQARGARRQVAVAALRADRNLRAACLVHLDVDDAVALATDLITAASTTPPRPRRRVGAPRDRVSTIPTTHGRTDRP
jgi:hypothetical protein